MSYVYTTRFNERTSDAFRQKIYNVNQKLPTLWQMSLHTISAVAIIIYEVDMKPLSKQ
jgi:hypothetical protein